MTQRTLPISARAVLQRANRKLSETRKQLRTCRVSRLIADFGHYFLVDLGENCVEQAHVDLEAFARELGVLQGWESLTDGNEPGVQIENNS